MFSLSASFESRARPMPSCATPKLSVRAIGVVFSAVAVVTSLTAVTMVLRTPRSGETPPALASTAPHRSSVLPVRSVEQARDLAAAELARIIAIMVAAADDHTHDPARAHMTTAPCGPQGGYTVDAFDGFLLPPDRHLAVAAVIRQRLADAGYTVGSVDVTPAGGFKLTFHSHDYEATIASGADNDSISAYVISACQLSPDGRFPFT